MATYGLMNLYQLSAKIGISKSGEAPDVTWTYAELAQGIDNVTEALNETVQQYFFLSDKGFARNHTTAMAPAFTITGRRVIGDQAQDYIFSKKYALDEDRQSSFQLSYVNAEGATVQVTCDCTICNIQEWAGASTEDSAISFEIRLDGEPEMTTTPAE